MMVVKYKVNEEFDSRMIRLRWPLLSETQASLDVVSGIDEEKAV